MPNELSNQEPTPDEVERALKAFHRGSTKEFEALLGDDGGERIPIMDAIRHLATGQSISRD